MGGRLGMFPHDRMTGGNRYRLRVGDYRIVDTRKTKPTSSQERLYAAIRETIAA